MTQITLDLLRHGETVASGIYQGSSDVALSLHGVGQMRNALHKGEDAGWQAVYSSPLKRCCEPAREAAERMGVPCTPLPWLTEYHFGSWDGNSFEAVYAQQPTLVDRFWRDPENNPPPGGEPVSRFQQRILVGLDSVLESGQTHLLLVTHGGVIRALVAHCLQMPYSAWSKIKLDHACFTRIQFYLDQNGQAPWGQLACANVARLPVIDGSRELDADL